MTTTPTLLTRVLAPFKLVEANISTFQSSGKYAAWRFSDERITTPFAFEIFEWEWWADYVSSKWHYSVYIGAAYLAVIFSLQRLMRNRKPLNLKTPLAIWNGALGIFSILGFIRSWPAFWNILNVDNGFYHSICSREGGDMSAAYWSLLFILSKFVELGDTVFIVLRKRPLVFLQWYHHLVTMVVTWVVGPFLEPITRWYTIMNFAVHSLMYPYFSLKALNVHIPRPISNTITTLQLSQMLMGLFVNTYTMLLISQGVSCYRHPLSMRIFIGIYGSFTFLFGKLFLATVLNNNSKTTAAATSRKKNKDA